MECLHFWLAAVVDYHADQLDFGDGTALCAYAQNVGIVDIYLQSSSNSINSASLRQKDALFSALSAKNTCLFPFGTLPL
jgi:hypothetical protein